MKNLMGQPLSKISEGNERDFLSSFFSDKQNNSDIFGDSFSSLFQKVESGYSVEGITKSKVTNSGTTSHDNQKYGATNHQSSCSVSPPNSATSNCKGKMKTLQSTLNTGNAAGNNFFHNEFIGTLFGSDSGKNNVLVTRKDDYSKVVSNSKISANVANDQTNYRNTSGVDKENGKVKRRNVNNEKMVQERVGFFSRLKGAIFGSTSTKHEASSSRSNLNKQKIIVSEKTDSTNHSHDIVDGVGMSNDFDDLAVDSRSMLISSYPAEENISTMSQMINQESSTVNSSHNEKDDENIIGNTNSTMMEYPSKFGEKSQNMMTTAKYDSNSNQTSKYSEKTQTFSLKSVSSDPLSCLIR